ncbi:dockerin type I domain-containing protein [Amedibacillus sp. YH-ame10]
MSPLSKDCDEMKYAKKAKVIGLGFMLTAITLTSMQMDSVFASDEKNDVSNAQSTLEKEGIFTALDKDGNITYIKQTNEDITDELELPEKTDTETTFDLKVQIGNAEPETIASYDTFKEANTAMNKKARSRSVGNLAVYTNDQIRAVTNGVVNFRTKACSVNTNYLGDGEDPDGYTNGCYGADAAYLGTNTDGTKVKFRLAGVTGWVNKDEVQIYDYDNKSQVKSISNYTVEGGRIYHNVTTNMNYAGTDSTQDIGPKQSYMSEGATYYSYDGHYFYTSYARMIADYKANTYNNSINPKTPYYSYYQFLSFRSKTKFSATDFNTRVASVVGSNKSALSNQGANYIDVQNTFGVNAALAFGISVNESGWGRSDYALNRNNIFGIAAFDSDPDNATKFPSVKECILQFSRDIVSIDYTDPLDASGLYHGSSLGDKSVGFNVKYASDPFWSEKAASHVYNLEKNTPNNKDFGNYSIGIKTNGDNINIRKEASTSSTSLYKTGAWNNYSFIILDTVTGQSVNGNTKWYKIATDPPLNASRTQIVRCGHGQGGEYIYTNNYAYVSAEYVRVLNDGNFSDGDYGMIPGDVNGDGTITPADYVKVKNHIMGKSTLTGDSLKAADMNGDGTITPADYVKIKNSIMDK